MVNEIRKDLNISVIDGYQPPVVKQAVKKVPTKEELKKEAAKAIKEKHYYDVKVECMLPATVTYRVLAEDPIQATELIKGQAPIGVKHRLAGKKDIKLTVYDASSSMIRYVKNLLGR
jgi:hypothetical protein